jgi:hypothetical protein
LRGLLELVILPKVACVDMLAAGVPRIAWLNKLKISARNCAVMPSRILVFFTNDTFYSFPQRLRMFGKYCDAVRSVFAG